MSEERRGFTLEGKIVWLTLTELQSHPLMSGVPTKYLMGVWENGRRKEAEV